MLGSLLPRRGSNRDRMSVTDVNLLFCASVETKIEGDAGSTTIHGLRSHISFCVFLSRDLRNFMVSSLFYENDLAPKSQSLEDAALCQDC